MLDLTNMDFNIKEDLEFILESEKTDVETLSKNTTISKTTISEIRKGKRCEDKVCEKFYSYAYDKGYRINLIKEEFLIESNKTILFHGSKNGLNGISYKGSRKSCDFGEGFYLGEKYESTLSFICEHRNSVSYSFELNLEGLNVYKFNCSLEWMLAICYYRGFIKKYLDNEIILEIIKKIKDADVIIAPIADNRMFYIMSLFSNGDITENVAIHSLSASNFGNQYVLKTPKAIEQLRPIEKYYIPQNEKEYYIDKLNHRTQMIETKLRLAKREFKDGLYIEEILK